MTRKNKGKRSNEQADIKNTIIQLENSIKSSNNHLASKIFKNQIDFQRNMDFRRSLDSSLELLLSSSLGKQGSLINRENTGIYDYEKIQAYNKPGFEIKMLENISNGLRKVSGRQGPKGFERANNREDLRKKGFQNMSNNYMEEISNQNPSSISDVHPKNGSFADKTAKNSYEKHLDLIFNKKDTYVPEFKRDEEDLAGVHDDMVKFFSIIPRYCYFLENERRNYKEKYDKALNDFSEQNIAAKDLAERVGELTRESKDLREAVLALASENSYLKNNQKVLNSFKEETDHFIEILKMDINNRNIDMEQLIKENSELKIKKSRKEHENEVLEVELKGARLSVERFKAELGLIRTEVENQFKSIEKVVGCLNRQEIYKKILEVEQKSLSLQNFKRFYEENKPILRSLEEGIRSVLVQKSELKSLIQSVQLSSKNKMEECEISLKKANEMNKNSAALLFMGIRPEAQSAKEQLDELAKKLRIYHKTYNSENYRKNFAYRLNKQKQEFDASKMKYEKQISELVRKIEEQEDVWEVFK